MRHVPFSFIKGLAFMIEKPDNAFARLLWVFDHKGLEWPPSPGGLFLVQSVTQLLIASKRRILASTAHITGRAPYPPDLSNETQ
jgi:hypothetical protein